MPKKKKDLLRMQGGPVKVPVLYPPRETIFEDTPITLTPHRPSETVLYTVDAPHAYKINPFAAETEKGRLKYYKRPFLLEPGIHRVAALSFSRSNPYAAPSATIRRTFYVHPRDSPPDPLQGRKSTQRAEPPSTNPAPVACEFVLLVDQSGSMRGLTFERIREAVKLIVRALPQDCRINLVGYGETAFPMWPRSVAGTTENCVKVLDYAGAMSTSQGATNLARALSAVLDPAPESAVFNTLRTSNSGTTAPATDSLRPSASTRRPSAMKRIPGYDRQVIVLSDGELQDYLDTVEVLRRNPYDRRLWLLSFGDRANRVLLSKLADEGNGGTEFVLSTDRSIHPTVLRLLERCQRKPKRLISSAMGALDRAMTRLDTGGRPKSAALTEDQLAERAATLKTVLWDAAAVTFDSKALESALSQCTSIGAIDVPTALEHNGRTALHHAASRGAVAVAAKLIEHAERPGQADAMDPGGRTPLHWAAWNGDFIMVRLLVEKGFATTDAPDNGGLTPAFLARQEGHGSIGDYLDMSAGRTPLHHAAWNGDLAAVDALIAPTGPPLYDEYRTAREQEVHDVAVAKKAAVLDPLDKKGLSAVFLATAQGHRAVVARLHKHHAAGAAEVRTFFAGMPDWTPLHWAAYRGSAEWVRQLLADGDERELKSRVYRGVTPLELALSRGKQAATAAQLLLAAENTPLPHK